MTSALHLSPKLSLDALSQFADSMATCLSSGLTPQRALTLSGATVPSKSFRRIVAQAVRACDQGMTVSAALEPGRKSFPHFFLPVIRAGELGGRQVEAFRLIYEHCHRTKPSRTVVRNTWLYPLICVLFGWMIRAGVFLWFGFYQQAGQFVWDTLVNGAVMVACGWLVLKIRPVRKLLDLVRLQIPIVRETEIRRSVALFLGTFRLVYSMGGLSVITMFDLALETVRNSAIRRDLLQARAVLDRNGGFDEAFAQPLMLEDRLKQILATSAIAGQLEVGLDRSVTLATGQLEFTLNLFNQFFQRLVSFEVVMSIVGTFVYCLFYSSGR